MLKNNKIHLIPQVVIDCAENFKTTKVEHMRENYLSRLEAIRDYCDQVIKSNSVTIVYKKNNISR
jgi:hypothetical protein